MLPDDSDDRLLAALRGDRVNAEDPGEAAELRAARRIGGVARSIDVDVPADPSTLFEDGASTQPPGFDALAAALGDELNNPDGPTAEPQPTNTPEPETSNVVPFARRVPVRAWLPSAAAAVIAILAGTVFFLDRGDDDQIAMLQLDPLISEGQATAELRGAGDDLRLHVDVEGLTTEDGYLELWLIDTEVSRLISLGPIQDDGVYRLPAGLDPENFPVVDVSVESFDGDPTHSGQSVFRGQFEL